MKRRKLIVASVCGVFCLVALVYYFVNYELLGANKTDKYNVNIDQTKMYSVSRVVDGDTFKAKVGNREITIRMLGINTPETVDPRKPSECFGKEASIETKRLLSDHQVKLEFNPNREGHDIYGRYLLYVYREDGLFINKYLVENGFAREYTVGKTYTQQLAFKEAQKGAIEANKGLWGECSGAKPSLLGLPSYSS